MHSVQSHLGMHQQPVGLSNQQRLADDAELLKVQLLQTTREQVLPWAYRDWHRRWNFNWGRHLLDRLHTGGQNGTSHRTAVTHRHARYQTHFYVEWPQPGAS